jgi:hypothetical protein
MKNSGRLRKPYKIARQLAREGDRHARHKLTRRGGKNDDGNYYFIA